MRDFILCDGLAVRIHLIKPCAPLFGALKATWVDNGYSIVYRGVNVWRLTVGLLTRY